MSKNITGFFGNFSAGCQNSISSLQWKVLREYNFSKKIIFQDFGLLGKIFRTFCEESSAGVPKMHSACPHESLMFFFEKDTFLFITFGIWTRNYPTFGGQKIRQACLKFKLDVGGYILRKGNLLFGKKFVPLHLFWTHGKNFLRTLAKILQHSCPNCILLVHGRSLRKYICLRKIIPVLILNWVKKLRLFVKKTAASSKLQPRCPDERFEEEHFLDKIKLDKSHSYIDRKENSFLE